MWLYTGFVHPVSTGVVLLVQIASRFTTYPFARAHVSFFTPELYPPNRRDASSLGLWASWMFARPPGVWVMTGRYQSETASSHTHVSGGYEVMSLPPNMRTPANESL